MSKVKDFEFCPEHLISFVKGGDCHLCKNKRSKLQEMFDEEPELSQDEEGQLSWQGLLAKLKELEKDGEDLSSTVSISDGGSETLGSYLKKDKRGNLYIEGQ
jgi:hypothetical protein